MVVFLEFVIVIAVLCSFMVWLKRQYAPAEPAPRGNECTAEQIIGMADDIVTLFGARTRGNNSEYVDDHIVIRKQVASVSGFTYEIALPDEVVVFRGYELNVEIFRRGLWCTYVMDTLAAKVKAAKSAEHAQKFGAIDDTKLFTE